MAKTFTKFGLKRDLNLGDIPEREQALNNILDDLRGSADSFIKEDLDFLEDLNLSRVRLNTISQFADSALRETTVVNGVTRNSVYEPIVSIENRIDRAYFTTSDPFFFGGGGPRARYYDNDKFSRVGGVDTDYILNPATFDVEDDFWERGNLEFPNKYNVQLLSLYGGVIYEGYFKPTSTASYAFRIITGTYIKFEFDDLTGDKSFEEDPITGTFNYQNANFATGLTTLVDQTKLVGTDVENDFIDGTSSLLGESRTINVNVGELEAYEGYKFRITIFVDEPSLPTSRNVSRSFNLDFSSSLFGIRNTNYKYLYDPSYFTNYNIGDFREFINNSLSRAGSDVGERKGIGLPSAGTAGEDYKNLNNFGSIISYYDFPISVADVEEDVDGCNLNADNTLIGVSNAEPNSTERIKQGNYVFGTGIPVGSRVTAVNTNSSVRIFPAPTSTLTGQTLTFVDHRGLVGYGVGDVNEDQISNITNGFQTTDFIANQIVLSSGLSSPGGFSDERSTPATTIIPLGNLIDEFTGGVITLKDPVGSAVIANQRFYVYQTIGLNNDALKSFCQGVFAKRLRNPIAGQDASAGTYPAASSTSLTIRLDDVDGLAAGMFVHLFPTIDFNTRLVNGVDENFSKVRIANVIPAAGNNRIEVEHVDGPGNAMLISDLNYVPDTITSITFTPPLDDINREVCFLPTDTSPPFGASAEGLTTGLNVSLVNTFSSDGGGAANNLSEAIYSRLEFRYDVTVDTSIEIQEFTGAQTIERYLPISDDDDNQFYMLIGDD